MIAAWLAAWWQTLSGVEVALLVFSAVVGAAAFCLPALFTVSPHEPDHDIESLVDGAPAPSAEPPVLPAPVRAESDQRGASGPVCACPHCVAHQKFIDRGYAWAGDRFVGVN